MHAPDLSCPGMRASASFYERIIAPRFPGLSANGRHASTNWRPRSDGPRSPWCRSGCGCHAGSLAHAPRLKSVHAFGTGVDGIADQETLAATC